jgi:nitrile hydratase
MSYCTHADLGGRDVPGRIVPEPEDDRFHAAWEPGALALTLAMGATGAWNLDMTRSARETLPEYPRLSYYAVWLVALTRMLEERGLVSGDELAAGHMLHAAVPLPRVLQAADVAAVLARGAPTERPATRPARFAVGDSVRTCSAQPAHHTRLPGYARGRTGRIEAVRGMHVFADTHARGQGESPQWLYSVAFDGHALWGAQAAPGSSVAIDAWEPYLEAAP